MNKILVLAEKPSVGREIARVLKCGKKGDGFLEGDKYIVTWALGHLVTLADPEAYDEKYKSWNIEDLPMLPKELKLVVIKKSGRQFNVVKSQMNRKDITEIVIATDAGREGELVARWIIEKAHVKKPLKRLWISSQTDKAIIEGFKNLRSGNDYLNLYKAAVCRAEADWLVGLNVTRALTSKYNAQLSAGRVQSPTLAMIVNREEEIKNFKSVDYYTINAKVTGINLLWENLKGNSSIYDEKMANDLLKKVTGSNGEVIDISEKEKKKFSPLLYDLTELQRDANKLWSYSAKETLNIMQRLYENYKLLTYPRTDSRYISSDIVATIPDRLKAVATGEYKEFTDKILREGIKANKNFVDDSKVTDHHAIIPTEERSGLSKLNSEERNIYNLVVKRFLSVMLPPYIYTQTTISISINGEIFKAKGNVVKEKGWRKVYDRLDIIDGEEEQELPLVKKGDKLKVNSVNIVKKKTSPPARFNEGTLLSAMENPQRLIKLEESDAKTLGETGGLGTVATRADIIEKLFNSFVIEKRGKDILPTSKGRQLISLVPEELKSPVLTAKWEKQLEDISKGKADSRSFLDNMRKYSSELVTTVKNEDSKFQHDNKTGNKCPNCGKYLLEVKGKNGTMNVCPDRACGYRENVSRTTNARCPECKRKLEIKGHGEGQIYTCSNSSCNFREKASVFKKRFDNKAGKVDKREIQNVMKKLNKEAQQTVNNPFADLMDMFNKEK